MGRNCYLAYPIDQAGDQGWLFKFIESVAEKFRDQGLIDVTFDPGDAFTVRVGAPVGPIIGAVNRLAANLADTIFAFLPSGTPTIGVPMEIDRAVVAGKDVIVFTSVDSWMLDYQQPNFTRVSLDYSGLDAAVQWLAARQEPSSVGEQDPLPVRILDEGGRMPTRGYEDDAGLDLYVSRTTIIRPGEAVDVPCSVAVELPEWSWGLLVGRSSARRVHGLLIHTGIIDAGYRGELFALAENTTDYPIQVVNGTRLAQLIVMPNLTKDLQPVQVQELTPSPRGSNGFGSTGD